MNSNENSMRKIFSILEYMGDMERTLSIQEISAALSISTPTVHRLLTGLKELGYVEQSANKQYYLTYKLYSLAGEVIERDGLLDRMIPIMNYLSMRYDCEVGLTGFDEMSIIHIISVGESVTFEMQPTPGMVSPAYCTAAGKLYLAQMGQEELKAWMSRAQLIPHTQNTIIDRDELLREIVRTRRRGYGMTVGESRDNLASVAFPVHEDNGRVVATLNLNFTVEKFQAQMSEEFISSVWDTLQRVSKH